MKKWLAVLLVSSLAVSVQSEMVYLEGVGSGTLTTGNLLDGVDNTGITTNVVEIPGLEITARSGGVDQKLNATYDYFGVNTDGSGDLADAFDAGEKMVVSFNREIQINRIDFNRLAPDEAFSVAINEMPTIVVEYVDLSSPKQSGYFDTNLIVSANTEIEFYTTGSSVVGLDGIDLTVLGGDPALSLVFSNGVSLVSAAFDGVAPTNYVLQSREDLSSGDWTTISGSFSSNAQWQVESTNQCGFYRAVAP